MRSKAEPDRDETARKPGNRADLDAARSRRIAREQAGDRSFSEDGRLISNANGPKENELVGVACRMPSHRVCSNRARARRETRGRRS